MEVLSGHKMTSDNQSITSPAVRVLFLAYARVERTSSAKSHYRYSVSWKVLYGKNLYLIYMLQTVDSVCSSVYLLFVCFHGVC